jgi:endonuclease YncB( thermonuclease family)
MSTPRKRSSATLVAAVIVLAVSLLLARGPGHRGRIALPDAARQTPVPAGKARIVKIVDGDTVNVLLPDGANAETEEKVRLFGINTPELHPRPGTPKGSFTPELFAQEACDYLASLCPVGGDVSLAQHGRDKYGRLLGVIVLADGRDANRLLIAAGLAKPYFLSAGKKDPLRLDYERAAEDARSARRGIWQSPGAAQ